MAAKKPSDDPEKYARHREDMARRSRERSAAGQDIGEIPPVVDPDRRELCKDDDELFERTYFPARFPLPFSPAHLEMSRRMERVIRGGGLEAVAFMRGGGKTTMAEVKVLKAILYGFRNFVVLLQASDPLAGRSLKKIKRELETNDRLFEDFPEVCYPIRKLNHSTRRAEGQRYRGRPTLVEWTADGVVMPTIEGSAASGSVIHIAGIASAFKGLAATAPDGSVRRPDLVLIDDAQTRASAKSPTQTGDRESVIADDALALAGPDRTIAAVMLCTPIYVNDLSERFLDPDRHPEWNRIRTKMLPKFPSRMDLWDQYAEARRQGQRNEDGGKAGRDFYAANREAMDAGAVVTWPERLKAGPFEGTSALELAMILHYTNPRTFAAEYQCEAAAPDLGAGTKELDPKVIATRFNGCPRLAVPAESSRLTAYFDCGKFLHWYIVTAWTEGFGGAVIDYGCWPRQARSFFLAEDARPKLADMPGMIGMTEAQLVFAGLTAMADEVLGRTYYRQGGGEAKLDMVLIDSGFQKDSVFQWVRQAMKYGCPIHPSKGYAKTATTLGVGDWTKRQGERVGHHWKLTTGGKDRTRSVVYDTDVWKSIVYGMLCTPPGDLRAAGLNLFGKDGDTHEMIAHHFAAEYAEEMENKTRGTKFDKWKDRPDRPNNHLWDCAVGAAVAASVAGLEWTATGQPAPPRRSAQPISLRTIQQAKRQGSPPPASPAATGTISLRELQQQKRGP